MAGGGGGGGGIRISFDVEKSTNQEGVCSIESLFDGGVRTTTIYFKDCSLFIDYSRPATYCPPIVVYWILVVIVKIKLDLI